MRKKVIICGLIFTIFLTVTVVILNGNCTTGNTSTNTPVEKQQVQLVSIEKNVVLSPKNEQETTAAEITKNTEPVEKQEETPKTDVEATKVETNEPKAVTTAAPQKTEDNKTSAPKEQPATPKPTAQPTPKSTPKPTPEPTTAPTPAPQVQENQKTKAEYWAEILKSEPDAKVDGESIYYLEPGEDFGGSIEIFEYDTKYYITIEDLDSDVISKTTYNALERMLIPFLGQANAKELRTLVENLPLVHRTHETKTYNGKKVEYASDVQKLIWINK